MKKPQITKETVVSYLFITLGSLVYALGQLYFIKPLHIPMGGVSGLALVANFLWSLPIGVVTIVLNIPLLFLGWKNMGKEFFTKTAFAAPISIPLLSLLGSVTKRSSPTSITLSPSSLVSALQPSKSL